MSEPTLDPTRALASDFAEDELDDDALDLVVGGLDRVWLPHDLEIVGGPLGDDLAPGRSRAA